MKQRVDGIQFESDIQIKDEVSFIYYTFPVGFTVGTDWSGTRKAK